MFLLRGLTLLATLFLFWCSASAFFRPCCDEGRRWSSISYRCDNYPAPVINVTVSNQAACLSIIEVCCMKEIQAVKCEQGKEMAIDGEVCAIRDTEQGAETFRECCQCCRLGIENRRYYSTCQSPNLGTPCDTKYMQCCLGQTTVGTRETPSTTESPGGGSEEAGSSTSTTTTTNNEMTSTTPSTDPGSDEETSTTPTPSSTGRRTGRCRDGNPCQQRCVDTVNGYKTCQCFTGYRLQQDGISCRDIDECVEGRARCPPRQVCFNTIGSFTCRSSRCLPGMIYEDRVRRCVSSGDTCSPGFTFNSLTRRCEDLNECGLGTDTCLIGERCENTVGSYTCRRIHHCGTGYTLDDLSQRCVDNDECLLGTHDCRGGYRCQNIQGSFRCVPRPCNSTSRFDHINGICVPVDCPPGFRSNGARRCVDINECSAVGRLPCSRFQRCINTRGSFYCRNMANCPSGYEATDRDRCEDIDECIRGTHKCGPEQQCINRQGNYFCQCPRGLRHDNHGRCIDVDECSYGASICPSNTKCTNTLGSYSCECVDGLQNGEGDSCQDVDECALQGVCQQSCVNVLGTFFCTCDAGYQLRDDKRSCEDIDECTQFGGRGGSVCAGNCINSPGSYRCDCPTGWRLNNDGKSCEDVNECLGGSAFCPHQDSLCINTKGGYKCPVVQCPDGFLRTNSSVQQNSIRCRRISTTCPECKKGLISRSFNFLSFASNVLVPAPLFSMTGSRLVDKFYTWELDLISARPMKADVEPATLGHFSLEKSRDFARVTLMRRVEGPQDVVLQLGMNVTNYYKGFEGKAQSHIYLYITESD